LPTACTIHPSKKEIERKAIRDPTLLKQEGRRKERRRRTTNRREQEQDRSRGEVERMSRNK